MADMAAKTMVPARAINNIFHQVHHDLDDVTAAAREYSALGACQPCQNVLSDEPLTNRALQQISTDLNKVRYMQASGLMLLKKHFLSS